MAKIEDILETYYTESFKAQLTRVNDPDITAAHEKIEALGKPVIDQYIKDNKIGHVLNALPPSMNLLRTQRRNAADAAEVFRDYFDKHIQGVSDIADVRKALAEDLVKTHGASRQDAEEYIEHVDLIVEEHKNYLAAQPASTPSIGL